MAVSFFKLKVPISGKAVFILKRGPGLGVMLYISLEISLAISKSVVQYTKSLMTNAHDENLPYFEIYPCWQPSPDKFWVIWKCMEEHITEDT